MNRYSIYVKTENIKQTRKDKKITVDELIDRLGFASRVSYYNLENGVVEPRISQMVTLSQILGGPVKKFFNV